MPMLLVAITTGFIAVLWLTQVLVRRRMDEVQLRDKARQQLNSKTPHPNDTHS